MNRAVIYFGATGNAAADQMVIAQYSTQYLLQVRFTKRHTCQHIFLSVLIRQ